MKLPPPSCVAVGASTSPLMHCLTLECDVMLPFPPACHPPLLFWKTAVSVSSRLRGECLTLISQDADLTCCNLHCLQVRAGVMSRHR